MAAHRTVKKHGTQLHKSLLVSYQISPFIHQCQVKSFIFLPTPASLGVVQSEVSYVINVGTMSLQARHYVKTVHLICLYIQIFYVVTMLFLRSGYRPVHSWKLLTCHSKYPPLVPQRRLQKVSTVATMTRFVDWLKWSPTVFSRLAGVTPPPTPPLPAATFSSYTCNSNVTCIVEMLIRIKKNNKKNIFAGTFAEMNSSNNLFCLCISLCKIPVCTDERTTAHCVRVSFDGSGCRTLLATLRRRHNVCLTLTYRPSALALPSVCACPQVSYSHRDA